MQQEFTSHKPGTFCWVDLATTDADGAKVFYKEIMGWEPLDMPYEGGVYTFLNVKGREVAALAPMWEDQKKMGIPSYWLSYVSVENASETMNKVRELGGTVVMDAMDVTDSGRFGILADPEGGMLAVWEPGKHKGAYWKNVPGALCWVEHGGHGNEKVTPFYEQLFGWSSQTQPMGDSGEYTTFTLGEEMIAGKYTMPPDMSQIPAHWLPYFMTDNIDLAIEKTPQHGGKVILDKMFVEGVGHFTVIQDPQGGVFGLVQ